MALFSRPEYQIGRGETPESRVEVPFFVAFMAFSVLALLLFHGYFQNLPLTIALAVSMVVFGITFLRVELGFYFLIVCMLLSPEIEAGQVGTSRSLSLRYDDILIIVVFLGVLVKVAFEGGRSAWQPSPVNAGIVLYFSVCLLSTMFALRQGLPMFEANKAATFFVMLKMTEFYMIFFLVGMATYSRPQMRRQLILFFIVAVIVAGYGVIGRLRGIERVSAPFETGGTEPNTLGGYLVLVICLSIAMYTQAPSGKMRAIAIGITAMACVPLLYTLSRASYLAFVVGVLAIGLATRRLGMVIALTGVLILSPYVMPQDVRDRVSNTFQPGGQQVRVGGIETGIEVDKSTHERIYVWEKVWFNLRWKPWLGLGVGWGSILDSQYARVLIETGIIGFCMFLFLQWRVIKMGWQAYQWSGDWVGRMLGLAVFAGTFALIAHSIGTISFLIVRMMEPYWFLVGLASVARSQAVDAYRERTAGQLLEVGVPANAPACPVRSLSRRDPATLRPATNPPERPATP